MLEDQTTNDICVKRIEKKTIKGCKKGARRATQKEAPPYCWGERMGWTYIWRLYSKENTLVRRGREGDCFIDIHRFAMQPCREHDDHYLELWWSWTLIDDFGIFLMVRQMKPNMLCLMEIKLLNSEFDKLSGS